jgi:hypothetical protein
MKGNEHSRVVCVVIVCDQRAAGSWSAATPQHYPGQDSRTVAGKGSAQSPSESHSTMIVSSPESALYRNLCEKLSLLLGRQSLSSWRTATGVGLL